MIIVIKPSIASLQKVALLCTANILQKVNICLMLHDLMENAHNARPPVENEKLSRRREENNNDKMNIPNDVIRTN